MGKTLQVGNVAPVFHTNDIFNRSVSLELPRGQWVLLSFYRYASCPLCNLRIHTLTGLYPKWERQGLVMIAVFQSPAEKIRQYVGRQDVPFTIIADPDRDLYKRYGVTASWKGFLKAWTSRLPEIGNAVFRQRFFPGTVEGELHRLPADFLIQSDGRIHTAYYGQDIGDHLPIGLIEASLKGER